jgi:3,4-dihydroxy 2-butanone 4-phosphate synthase
MCQKAHGASFASFARIRHEDFSVIAGEEAVTTYRSSNAARRTFCSRCGSALQFIRDDAEAFAESFRSPGHVHLLRAAPGLLTDREGHTELGIALADAADQPPAVVVCEMLDDETGGALPPAAARAYADREGLPYIEGRAIIEQLG